MLEILCEEIEMPLLLIGIAVGLILGGLSAWFLSKWLQARSLAQLNKDYLLLDRSLLVEPQPMRVANGEPICSVCTTVQAMSEEVQIFMDEIPLWSSTKVIAHQRTSSRHPSDGTRSKYTYIWYDFNHAQSIPEHTRLQATEWLTSSVEGASLVVWNSREYLKIYGPVIQKNVTEEWVQNANLAAIDALQRFINPDLTLVVPGKQLEAALS